MWGIELLLPNKKQNVWEKLYISSNELSWVIATKTENHSKPPENHWKPPETTQIIRNHQKSSVVSRNYPLPVETTHNQWETK